MNDYEKKQAARRERAQARVERLEAEFERKRKNAMNRFPGSFVAGRANYPVRAHNKAYAAVDRAYAKLQEAQQAAKSIGQSKAISSDDPDAIGKLQSQLQEYITAQEKMKAANRIMRGTKPENRLQALISAGFSQPLAEKILAMDIIFDECELASNNANIRRIKKRIELLEKTRDLAPVEITGTGYEFAVDPADNRILFTFPGKPDESIRAILKRHAFKWSPSRGAWVRQLTPNAQYAAREVRRALESLNMEHSAAE